MLPVFLLEDDKQQLATYQQIINNAIMINEFAMKLIVASDNVADFERQLTITKQGVFFLDMEISDDKQAGLKVAERIKAQVPFAKIAFITTHEELSFLTLKRKIAPFDYILKDEGIESIKQHLRADVDLAYENYEKTIYHHKSLFGYKIGDRYFSLPMSELMVLYTDKTKPGDINLVADNVEASFPGNLNHIEQQHPNLFRCDKSYLVNLDNLESYDAHRRVLKFKNNVECKVSFRKARELKKLLK